MFFKVLSLVAISAVATSAFAKPNLAVKEAPRSTEQARIEEGKRTAEIIKIDEAKLKTTSMGKELVKLGWFEALKDNSGTITKLSTETLRMNEALVFASKRSPSVAADVATVKAVLQHMAVTTGNFKAERYENSYKEVQGNQALVDALDGIYSNGAYFMSIKGKSSQEAQLLALNKVRNMKSALEVAKKEGSRRAITELNEKSLSDIPAEEIAELKAIDKELQENNCRVAL